MVMVRLSRDAVKALAKSAGIHGIKLDPNASIASGGHSYDLTESIMQDWVKSGSLVDVGGGMYQLEIGEEQIKRTDKLRRRNESFEEAFMRVLKAYDRKYQH